MSSSDYLRYLRALKRGPDFRTISEATGVPAGILRQMEQRYRPLGNEEILRKLAIYYDLPAEELFWRHAWSRRDLTFFLQEVSGQDVLADFELATGSTLSGRVQWFDLGSFSLLQEDGREAIVQRHVVERWRRAGQPFSPPAGEETA